MPNENNNVKEHQYSVFEDFLAYRGWSSEFRTLNQMRSSLFGISFIPFFVLFQLSRERERERERATYLFELLTCNLFGGRRGKFQSFINRTKKKTERCGEKKTRLAQSSNTGKLLGKVGVGRSHR